MSATRATQRAAAEPAYAEGSGEAAGASEGGATA